MKGEHSNVVISKIHKFFPRHQHSAGRGLRGAKILRFLSWPIPTLWLSERLRWEYRWRYSLLCLESRHCFLICRHLICQRRLQMFGECYGRLFFKQWKVRELRPCCILSISCRYNYVTQLIITPQKKTGVLQWITHTCCADNWAIKETTPPVPHGRVSRHKSHLQLARRMCNINFLH